METCKYHIMICNSYRTKGDPKGLCNKKGAADLPQYIENEVIDRGLDVMVSTTSCFKRCDKGPLMVVYPNGWWYPQVDEDKIDEILDALEEDAPCDALLAE
ncbi:MAG TPA: ferredoxin [Phycisphaerales bacterium]|nr:ferredoxin [Phycisphaerales bacterium]HCD31807.1 ferredoxin [Phycisphaerales bacterium]|tara:strand:+ start:235 stop:537 length:303 start_codon:yes stop_codon:yes gene_type:complete